MRITARMRQQLTETMETMERVKALQGTRREHRLRGEIAKSRGVDQELRETLRDLRETVGEIAGTPLTGRCGEGAGTSIVKARSFSSPEAAGLWRAARLAEELRDATRKAEGAAEGDNLVKGKACEQARRTAVGMLAKALGATGMAVSAAEIDECDSFDLGHLAGRLEGLAARAEDQATRPVGMTAADGAEIEKALSVRLDALATAQRESSEALLKSVSSQTDKARVALEDILDQPFPGGCDREKFLARKALRSNR